MSAETRTFVIQWAENHTESVTLSVGLRHEGSQAPAVHSEPMASLDSVVLKSGVNMGEQRRWLQNGYRRAQPPILITESSLGRFRHNVESTLDLIRRSKSAELQQAYNTFSTASRQGILMLQPDLLPLRTSRMAQDAAMTVETRATPDNRLLFIHHISVNYVLNASNALQFAGDFAHEMEHVRSHLGDVKSFGHIPASERRLIILDKATHPSTYAQEEARGYAAATRAYIQLYGLVGNLIENPQAIEEAKLFLAVGQDPTHSAWINHVQATYLR